MNDYFYYYYYYLFSFEGVVYTVARTVKLSISNSAIALNAPCYILYLTDIQLRYVTANRLHTHLCPVLWCNG